MGILFYSKISFYNSQYCLLSSTQCNKLFNTIPYSPTREYPNIRGSHQEFCDFLNTCYYTKRKMLKNACACLFGEDTVATALKELGLSSKERAEKLQVNDFVILFNLLRVKDIN